jgi:hypothetical protein
MLNPEDILKLNVLVATSIAIRIDVYQLSVIGLNAKYQEQVIKLQPSGKSEAYLKAVKKMLTEKVLGAMGGYPSYLKRWSRMGQVGALNLASLLKLGEVEAVIAVANASNLDKSLLNLTWWCATNTDNQAEIGRFLLTKPFVLETQTGRDISHYLLEFLPFLEDVEELIETCNLILQAELISSESKAVLWKQGVRKTAFLVGFLERNAGYLPNDNHLQAKQYPEAELAKVASEQGQIFLQTVSHILKKINQEYILYRVLDVLGQYLAHPFIQPLDNIEALNRQAQAVAKQLGMDEHPKVVARLLLAGVSEHLVIRTISAHNLTGSAIRKKLSFVLNPVQGALMLLQS